MFVFNRDFRHVRMCVCVAVRQVICACSIVHYKEREVARPGGT